MASEPYKYINTQYSDRRKMRTSKAWEYFDVVDEEKKIATCNQCQTLFSYKSTVSNLVKHLRRKHSVHIGKASDDEDESNNNTYADSDDESSTNVNPRLRSTIWKYFKNVDILNKIAMCRLCKTTLSHSSSNSNLKRHLMRLHPELNLTTNSNRNSVILSASDGLFELQYAPKTENDYDDNQVPDDVEEVYIEDLDDLDCMKQNKHKSTKKRKCSFTKPRKLMLRNKRSSSSNSSDEEVTFKKRYVKIRNDSLDYFGKYVTSLLKQLPKELSNQLQMDFIKQIMNAQLTYDTQRAVPPKKNNGYSITIVQEPEQGGGIEETSVPEAIETQLEEKNSVEDTTE